MLQNFKKHLSVKALFYWYLEGPSKTANCLNLQIAKRGPLHPDGKLWTID